MPSVNAHRRAADERHRSFARRYGDALRRASIQTAEALVDEALAAGVSAAEVQSEIIRPAMCRIGDLWEQSVVTVAEEHLATAISEQALIGLYSSLQIAAPRSRERVLLAAVQGQHHTLGLRMVADVLEGAGFDVLYLGADVPTGSLVQMVVEQRPAVTGLSCRYASGTAALVDALVGIADSGAETRILLGGKGVPVALRSTGYPWCDNSMGVVEAVEALLTTVPARLSDEIRVLQRPAMLSDAPRSVLETESPDGRLQTVIEEATEQSRRYARRAQEYRYLAFHDPVTQMFNRRAFDDRLTEMSQTMTDDMLLMVDVDHFKSVNDTHGHDVGDALLKTVGQAIRAGLRPGDFAARTGGDEFAVLLPNCKPELAVGVAERVRANVAEGNPYGVTASIGLAALTGNPRAVILAADEALYAAKEAGRNRATTCAPIGRLATRALPASG